MGRSLNLGTATSVAAQAPFRLSHPDGCNLMCKPPYVRNALNNKTSHSSDWPRSHKPGHLTPMGNRHSRGEAKGHPIHVGSPSAQHPACQLGQYRKLLAQCGQVPLQSHVACIILCAGKNSPRMSMRYTAPQRRCLCGPSVTSSIQSPPLT